MAVFGLSVTKEITWRGQQQQWSNVYHFQTGVAEPFDDTAAINAVVAAEKLIHTTIVLYRRARTWGPTDQGAAASVTRQITDLTGTGAKTASPDWYRELAILVNWPLGRYGSRNRPQFLRKWLHTMTLPTGPSSGFGNGTTIATTPTEIATYIASVTSVGPGPYELCSDSGRVPIAAGTMYPYLEHRQLGR